MGCCGKKSKSELDIEAYGTPEQKEKLRQKQLKRKLCAKKCKAYINNNPAVILAAVMVLVLVGLGVAAYIIGNEIIQLAIIITDCPRFANKTTVPSFCPEGRELYGSLCYLSCPPGYVHSAACTCTKGSTITDCELYGNSTIPTFCRDISPTQKRQYYGGACYDACDDGAVRTAACTCTSGNTITDCKRFGNGYSPTECGPGREYYNTLCLNKCPDGYNRADICSCYKGATTTDCFKYGFSTPPVKCDPVNGVAKEYYGSTCVNKCPNGYTRTGACTCQTGAVDFDCSAYGYKSPLRCPPGKVYKAGLCYDPCPAGGDRTAICTCQWPGIISPSSKGSSCPSGRPYEIAGLCYGPTGPLTSCEIFGSSVSIPDRCNDDEEKYAGACYGKCPAGKPRTSACTCGSVTIATSCSAYGQPNAIGTPNGPKCEAGQDLFGGLCMFGACPSDQSRTASCTCSNFESKIDCVLYSNASSIGLPGGPQCAPGSDLFGGLCLTSCPSGIPRTASCTCDNAVTTTDCGRYGNGKSVGLPYGPECPDGEDLWGGLCYNRGCTDGKTRTASCTCSDEDTLTDCTLYGDGRSLLDPFQLGPRCGDDEDYHAGLCYSPKCPEGYVRSAICTCQIKEPFGFVNATMSILSSWYDNSYRDLETFSKSFVMNKS